MVVGIDQSGKEEIAAQVDVNVGGLRGQRRAHTVVVIDTMRDRSTAEDVDCKSAGPIARVARRIARASGSSELHVAPESRASALISF